jgi:CHAT domain-containing protein
MSERLRTQIIGGEQERAAFAGVLGLSGRAHAYASVLAQLHREAEVLGILERGRARAGLDLLERSGHDLVAQAQALGDSARTQRLQRAQEAEQQARVALNDAESLLAGRRKERTAWEKMTDQPEGERTRRLAELDREIAELANDVKEKRQTLTRAGDDVLVELRGLFPAAQPRSTEQILNQLAPDEALVSFSWGNDSVLVAIAAGGQTAAEIVATDKDATQKLTESATKLRAALAERPGAAPTLDPAAAHELLATLLPEALRARLAGCKRLIVLPDGPLNGIPLEALLAPDAQSPLADKALVYAPSGTVYLDRKGTGSREQGTVKPLVSAAVVVGAPIFDRERQEPEYPKQGVLLAAAVDGGNAAKVGLKRGDVLLRYDGQKLDEQTPLPKAIAVVNEAVQKGDRPADQPVNVAYWRDGQEAEVELPPGKLGVQVQSGSAADGLRSMALIDAVTRGGGEFAASASATEQVRLFGGVLPPLPGTDREARAIAKLLAGPPGGGQSVALLIGPDATVARLNEAVSRVRPKYLHLATHALMGSADRPLDASLALTQPEKPTPEDIGFLRLEDLLSQWGGKLTACELVVLSACDTQRGERRGDTVMSLPLGFFFAGARTVVASLWKVDDTATALLMQRFYENLLGQYDKPRDAGAARQPLPKAEALREAKLWLRNLTADEALALAAQLPGSQDRGTVRERPATEEPSAAEHPYAAPYYWAAFILLGDPD